MKTDKHFIIGESSKKFLMALEAFQDFKNLFMDALEYQQGEEQANQFFMEHLPKFEDVERIIMDYLRINFTSETADENETITI